MLDLMIPGQGHAKALTEIQLMGIQASGMLRISAGDGSHIWLVCIVCMCHVVQEQEVAGVEIVCKQKVCRYALPGTSSCRPSKI